MKLEAKLLTAFIAVLVITSSVAGFGYKTQVDRNETIRWVEHTNQVMLEIDLVLENLLNMETGFRGYMITGQEEFLEPYNASLQEIEESLIALRELTSDNPRQLERWNELETDYGQWRTEWVEPGNEIRRKANQATLSKSYLEGLVAEGAGKTAIDQIRSNLAQLEASLERQDDLASVILVNKILQDMINQETGMRGFIVTGNEIFLEPYNQGQESLTEHIAVLQTRLMGDSANQEYVDQIESLAAQWKENMAKEWIAAQQEVNANPTTVVDVAAYIETAGGKQMMDAMRTTLADAMQEEATLLDERRRADVATASLSNKVTIFGSIIAVTIGLVVAFILARSIANAAGQIAYAAGGLARGELDLEVNVNTKDEMGDLAAAFKRMMAYIQEMAEVAGHLAQGNLAVDVSPQSEKDVLGNAFVHMIAYQKEMAGAAGLLAQGDVTADVTPQSNQDVLGNAFARMIVYQQEMADVAGRLTQSDLTANIVPQSNKDMLGNAFAQMIGNLRNLIGRVAASANNVGAASGQFSATADQAAQATGQVATTIQQVANGTAQQAESVTRATTIVEQVTRAIDGVAQGAQEQAAAIGKSAEVTAQISTVIQQVTANAQAGAKGSAQAAQAAHDGVQTVDATIKGMDRIKEKVGISATKVREMGKRSNQIGAIVETINDIASQTNLLALNAAIEAARAGAHGRGFAVVADEVRKLAESAAEATKEIGELIRVIQQTVAEAVQAMDEGADEIEAGATRADESGQALDAILTSIEAVNQQVNEIAAAAQQMNTSSDELVGTMDTVSAVVEENTAATEEMAAGADQVSQSMESIAAVSEENSAAAEQVSATVEEMSAQSEEVTASAQSLAAMAQELQALVAQFRLPGAEAHAPTPRVDWEMSPGPVVPAPVGGNGPGYDIVVSET